MDASGVVVVDAMVYGSQQSNSSATGTIASPEIATLEAEQGQRGWIVLVPIVASGAGRSRGRFPDGSDADNLCTDFLTQPDTTLSAASAAGAANIKVASVADFAAGQTIMIDTGANLETAVIATVGTAGATTVGTATDVGATVMSVASAIGVSAGQTITTDTGANYETAVVASIARGRSGATITVAAPLAFAHAAGVRNVLLFPAPARLESGPQVSGTGITLTAALTLAHANGAQVASNAPTPGAPKLQKAPIARPAAHRSRDRGSGGSLGSRELRLGL